MSATLAAAVFTFNLFFAQAASAAEPIIAAIGALGAVAAYNACFQEVMAVGNNAYYQEQTRLADRKTNGVSPFRQDHIVTNRVMEKLLDKGEYELEIRSLPFRWSVNDNDEFNAACYPTNFISVNRGLIEGLNGNEDEMAAVLGHELFHGLKQHAAQNYAKAMAASIGMTMIGASTGQIDGQTLAILTDYTIAKNVTLPTEYEADEGGFYLAATAGFNPGGAAAAMVRMKQITDNIAEFKGKFDQYDHPDIENREKKLAGFLTAYSANHVTVDKTRILIDGSLLASTEWTDSDNGNTQEAAYLIGGALGRAFHDCDNLSAWRWRTDEYGQVDYLDDRAAYAPLKNFIRERHLERDLQKLVTEAYSLEVVSGERTKLQERDAERREALSARLAKNKAAEAKLINRLVENGDAYNDLFLPRYSRRQTMRVFDCDNPTNVSMAYAVLARAAMTELDFAEAENKISYALLLQPNSAFNIVTNAEIHRAKGDAAAALAECERAAKSDPGFAAAWRIGGDIAAELGDREKALSFYRQYRSLAPNAALPFEYLREISPKDAARIKEQREQIAKEWAKEFKIKEGRVIRQNK